MPRKDDAKVMYAATEEEYEQLIETDGKNLKEKKKVHVIAQNADTCTVYGMPKSVAAAGLTDVVVPLGEIAQEIILRVGVR